MKFQEGSVLKYLNFQIWQCTLDFSFDQSDNIMEIVNEWFPTGKYRKVDRTDSTYENYIMAALQLIVNAHHKVQCMNGIQGAKTFGRQWKIILNAVVTIIKYKKSPIDRSIYINVFFDVIMSYLTVSTDDVLNTTNNEIEFTELRRFLKKLLIWNSKKHLSLST